MNIKSLLLGSAAALVAVSGARAADAVEVVAEPEPMEYVRVCDTYGTGFYYIPGTETCLRVGGYVRYDIGVGDLYGINDVLDKQDFSEGILNTNDTYYKRARASLILDARSETELGTLRGFMQMNFDWDTTTTPALADIDGDGVLDVVGDFTTTNSPGTAKLAHAYIELGGFRIGKTDSLFTTFTDYAGGVINDDVIGFGPYDTHQIAYTFDAGNGFTAAVALEEGSGVLYTIDSYVPHVAAGVGYTAGWGSVRVVGGYDSVWEEFAVKARLDVKASETISLFVMGGYKSDELNNNYYGTWAGDWAIWGGVTAQVSEKATVNAQLSYDDGDNFYAVANVAYELVPGFRITPEVGYYDNLDDDDGIDDDGEFGGFLRFQRNF
jgi:hypothetical protein